MTNNLETVYQNWQKLLSIAEHQRQKGERFLTDILRKRQWDEKKKEWQNIQYDRYLALERAARYEELIDRELALWYKDLNALQLEREMEA